MHTVKNNLWSTPVWEIDTGFDVFFNNSLKEEISFIIENKLDPMIFNHDLEHIKKLKDKIIESIEVFRKEIFPDNNFKFAITKSYATYQEPNQILPLHTHGGTFLVANYYVQCFEKSGDLLLVDPRGGVNWDTIYQNSTVDIMENSNVKYHRIKPSDGKLVIFPGYVMHMTEPNKTMFSRISIPVNFAKAKLE